MNKVHTTISGRGDDGIARVRGRLDELAAANRLAADPVNDMHVALDEILSNTLRNGFGDEPRHRIEVTLSVDARTLTATIEDDCAPFDPLSVPAPDLQGSLRERRVGGLGIHFVKSLMSEVTYAHVRGRNRLVLRKNLGDVSEGR